jgi:hypothetical protein
MLITKERLPAIRTLMIFSPGHTVRSDLRRRDPGFDLAVPSNEASKARQPDQIDAQGEVLGYPDCYSAFTPQMPWQQLLAEK